MCSYDKRTLAAISYRHTINCRNKDDNLGYLHLESYSDCSGSHHKALGFATLEEAKDFLVKEVESGRVDPSRVCGKGGKYQITCPKVEAYKAENKAKAEALRLKDIEKKEGELARLKGEKCDSEDDEDDDLF